MAVPVPGDIAGLASWAAAGIAPRARTEAPNRVMERRMVYSSLDWWGDPGTDRPPVSVPGSGALDRAVRRVGHDPAHERRDEPDRCQADEHVDDARQRVDLAELGACDGRHEIELGDPDEQPVDAA